MSGANEATQDERDGFLLRLVEQVPFHGWTEKALDVADPGGLDARRLFPRGMAGAIDHFAGWADRQMERALDGVELDAFRIRDVIGLLVKSRLEALAPYREAVRREAGWLALHGPDLAPRLLWRTADRIWRLAGDTSTDFNHYSKRALLSGVIASTTLCWLGDGSADNEVTWTFLDRRIDDVMVWGRRMGRMKKFADPSRLIETVAGYAGRLRYR